MCERVNITDELIEKYAAKACEELDEKYCIVKATEKCNVTPYQPIDFIYERKTDSYNLDRYKSDKDLIRKI